LPIADFQLPIGCLDRGLEIKRGNEHCTQQTGSQELQASKIGNRQSAINNRQ